MALFNLVTLCHELLLLLVVNDLILVKLLSIIILRGWLWDLPDLLLISPRMLIVVDLVFLLPVVGLVGVWFDLTLFVRQRLIDLLLAKNLV